MSGRYLIYTPTINSDTFVLFFSRGTSGRSFSIRDYSYEPVLQLSADDYPDATDRTILGWAREPGCYCIEGLEPHQVEDVEFWRQKIAEFNRLHLGKDLEIQAQIGKPAGMAEWRFPMLDLDVFESIPKSRKTKDVARMQSSPNSEDWVTWNVVRLLSHHDQAAWWPPLLRQVNRQTATTVVLTPPSKISPWVSVSSPAAYELESRKRMAASDDPSWVARASHPDPVEGHSEIDIVIEGEDYVIYVEAKLLSDISLSTTYDPNRNQLVRNIDCALEHRGHREPLFWMAVKDLSANRQYVQVIGEWKRDPSLLIAQLPHQDPDGVRRLVDRIAIITWIELLAAINPWANEVDVWKELQKRIS